MVVVSLTPIVHLEKNIMTILFLVWMFVLYASICTTSMPFYFRYRLLCHNKQFTPKLHICYTLIIGIVNIIYIGQLYYAFCLRPQQYFYLGEQLAPHFGDRNGKLDVTGIIGTVSAFNSVIVNTKIFSSTVIWAYTLLMLF